MNRPPLVLLIVAVALVPSTGAAAPLFLSGVPTAFVPGTAFSFEVGLPPIDNLGAYNVELLLTSSSGIAGTDFFFDLTATVPSPVNYVFPSSINYFDAANVDSPTQHRLTLSDFDFDGVNVAAGTNDLIAHVVIQTAVTFLGDLDLSFYVDGLFLDTPEIEPVDGFETILADTEAAAAITLSPVPEPSTRLLGLLGALVPMVLARKSVARSLSRSRRSAHE